MSEKILVLLGNKNTFEGVLSTVAKKRADKAIALLKDDAAFSIIPTGAFGEHFNTSSIPHGELLRDYLVESGIDESCILPHTCSSNTIEDAYGVLRIISDSTKVNSNRLQIHVITSGFHMDRVKFIFGRVLQGHKLEFHKSDDKRADAEASEWQNEPKKLCLLKKEWVDISNYNLKTFPGNAYENLGYELRHYDNLSYFALAGAFFFFSFLFSKSLFSECVWFMVGQNLSAIILVTIFWHLYLRLANTAASARRVLEAVEKLYGIPGISSTKLRPILGIIDEKIKIKKLVSIIIIFLLIAICLKAIILILS